VESIEAGEAPECVNAPTGYESLPPLLRGLLGAAEQRWRGSVVVRNAVGALHGVLRCHAGHVIAGLVQRAPNLLESVVESCSRRDLVSISFANDVDLVGGGPTVTSGRLDVLQLTAAVLRAGFGEDCVAAAVQFIGQRSLLLSRKVPLERYAFTSSERRVVELMYGAPHTLAEIARDANAPRDAVERIVSTLWITRAVALAPAWLRAISSAVDQPTMSLAPPRSDADDPTLVITPEPRPSGRYSERPPADTADELWEEPSHTRCSPPLAASPQARADEYFEVAQVLLSRGYAREAVLQAQKAMRLYRPTPDQEALYAWALYQRSGAGRTVHAHVWEHLENALRADPACELARRYWALLAGEGGAEPAGTSEP
jgi:hypothetical protein